MSEGLKQAGGNEALEIPVELVATFATPAFVYDLKTQQLLGHTNRVSFTLDPWQPTLLAVLTKPVPQDELLATLARAQTPPR